MFCHGKLLSRIEEQDYELLFGINVSLRGCSITRDPWGEGWVFEADESFRSWCMIAYGFEPMVISDFEYDFLQTNKVMYVGKERMVELRKSYFSQLSLVAINS